MKSAIFQLETLACPTCVMKIEKAVKSIDGVDKDSVKVLFNASKVKFNYDEMKTNEDEVTKSINKVGYQRIL